MSIIVGASFQGWCSRPEQEKLQNLATEQQHRSKLDFLEIGSWKGKSGIAIASVLTGDRRLWMVDHFCGNPVEQYGKRKKPGGKYFRRKDSWAYPELLENVIKFKMQNKVIILPLSSEQAARVIDEQFCFVFIDGDHSSEGVSTDFRLWFPHLEKYGVIIFHDPNNPPVTRFLSIIREHEDLEEIDAGTLAAFTRIDK